MKSIMHKNRFRGFTLIELLVVIAIIGILSAVVLASLTTARSKGSDAAIQSDLNTIQTQAEIYYNDNGSKYNSTGSVVNSCAATAGTMFANSGDGVPIANAIQGINNNGSSPTCNITLAGDAYAVSAASKSKTGVYFCVDSTGNSTTTTTSLSTNTVCP